MQVSTDSTLKFIARMTGLTKDGQRSWYRLTVADDKGDIVNIYSEMAVYQKTMNLQIGDPLGLVMRITQGSKGLSVTATDAIL